MAALCHLVNFGIDFFYFLVEFLPDEHFDVGLIQMIAVLAAFIWNLFDCFAIDVTFDCLHLQVFSFVFDHWSLVWFLRRAYDFSTIWLGRGRSRADSRFAFFTILTMAAASTTVLLTFSALFLGNGQLFQFSVHNRFHLDHLVAELLINLILKLWYLCISQVFKLGYYQFHLFVLFCHRRCFCLRWRLRVVSCVISTVAFVLALVFTAIH